MKLSRKQLSILIEGLLLEDEEKSITQKAKKKLKDFKDDGGFKGAREKRLQSKLSSAVDTAYKSEYGERDEKKRKAVEAEEAAARKHKALFKTLARDSEYTLKQGQHADKLINDADKLLETGTPVSLIEAFEKIREALKINKEIIDAGNEDFFTKSQILDAYVIGTFAIYDYFKHLPYLAVNKEEFDDLRKNYQFHAVEMYNGFEAFADKRITDSEETAYIKDHLQACREQLNNLETEFFKAQSDIRSKREDAKEEQDIEKQQDVDDADTIIDTDVDDLFKENNTVNHYSLIEQAVGKKVKFGSLTRLLIERSSPFEFGKGVFGDKYNTDRKTRFNIRGAFVAYRLPIDSEAADNSKKAFDKIKKVGDSLLAQENDAATAKAFEMYVSVTEKLLNKFYGVVDKINEADVTQYSDENIILIQTYYDLVFELSEQLNEISAFIVKTRLPGGHELRRKFVKDIDPVIDEFIEDYENLFTDEKLKAGRIKYQDYLQAKEAEEAAAVKREKEEKERIERERKETYLQKIVLDKKLVKIEDSVVSLEPEPDSSKYVNLLALTSNQLSETIGPLVGIFLTPPDSYQTVTEFIKNENVRLDFGKNLAIKYYVSDDKVGNSPIAYKKYLLLKSEFSLIFDKPNEALLIDGPGFDQNAIILDYNDTLSDHRAIPSADLSAYYSSLKGGCVYNGVDVAEAEIELDDVTADDQP